MNIGLRRRDFFGLTLLPLVACSKGDSQEADLDARWKGPIANLEQALSTMMRETPLPGLSVAVIEDGKLIWRKAFGVKDTVSKAPVDTDTIFEAASMSKPVFAYAVMKLCERGVLNLDTPLTKYTPERFLEGDPRLDLITARHVLSHTSGFQNWREEGDQPLTIHFTPGEKFMYSGEGYSYLLSVVAHVTGQPFEQYMQENILTPFGMDSSGYVWNSTMEQRAARPHDNKNVPFENKKSTPTDVARYGSAGSLQTTPGDYAKFMLEVLAPKPADKYRLSPESLKEMLRPQVQLNDKFGTSWALGWRIAPNAAGDVISHGGDNDGFHCWALMSLQRKSGVVMMTNGDNGAPLLVQIISGETLKAVL
ncbi:MAG: serine hydrolase domain-containing protein [Acidobacteriota bacterium]